MANIIFKSLEEFKAWIKTTKMVTYGGDNCIENCDGDGWIIYDLSGVLYKIYDYGESGGHLSERWGGKGYVRGEYEALEVERKVKMVEEITYEEVNGGDNEVD